MNFQIVKDVIDNISETGVAYKEKNRGVQKTCVLVMCTPCIVFSTITRIISCPFQCIFNRDVGCNPCVACLTDSTLTMPSDKCIYTSYRNVDEILKLPIIPPLTNEEELEILRYAALTIGKTKNVKHRYAISDFVKTLMFKHHSITLGECTPLALLKILDSRKPN